MQIMVSRIFPQIAKGFNDTFSLPLFDVMSLKVKRRPDSSNGLNVAQKLQLTTNHSNSIAWARFWFWYGFGSGFGFSFGFGSGLAIGCSFGIRDLNLNLEIAFRLGAGN